jgi:COP9 signalosome complex subunit 12
VYLTLERGRDIAQRNLLRKVFLTAGYDDLKEGQTEADRIRRSRIPLAHFAAALRMGASEQNLDDEEIECMIANTIYKVSALLEARAHLQP